MVWVEMTQSAVVMLQILAGVDGNDKIFGEHGDDAIWRGPGNDIIDGGDVHDSNHEMMTILDERRYGLIQALRSFPKYSDTRFLLFTRVDFLS